MINRITIGAKASSVLYKERACSMIFFSSLHQLSISLPQSSCSSPSSSLYPSSRSPLLLSLIRYDAVSKLSPILFFLHPFSGNRPCLRSAAFWKSSSASKWLRYPVLHGDLHCFRDLGLTPGPTGGCTGITTANGGCYGDFSVLNQDGGGWDNTVTSVRSVFLTNSHEAVC